MAPAPAYAAHEASRIAAEESTAVLMLARRRAATVAPASIARPVVAQVDELPVVLRRDLTNQVGSPTGGYGECEITVDANGALRVYAPGGGGGGGGATLYSTTIDFGSTPVYGSTFTVTNGAVSGSSKIVATVEDLVSDDGDEGEMDGIVLMVKPLSGAFKVAAVAVPGPVTGQRRINYLIG